MKLLGLELVPGPLNPCSLVLDGRERLSYSLQSVPGILRFSTPTLYAF